MLAAAAGLFEHASVRVSPDGTVDAAGLLGIWKSLIVLYPDGTPRTKHMVNLSELVRTCPNLSDNRGYPAIWDLTAVCASYPGLLL
ncbi:hypothetical protein F0Q45_16155 [Mycobacterium simiae]|uniref:Uncharacterized protein n=1 Tax=Mycobacterium simiae TaxID=1784 RepID=A0A5B1BME4_MYCSI|nr:hypothetical protein [Mycobacterium simiae]KAA1249262.1 hypothetical protein F0Q45_16155 [Mycobacterium simiae]